MIYSNNDFRFGHNCVDSECQIGGEFVSGGSNGEVGMVGWNPIKSSLNPRRIGVHIHHK